MWWFNNYLISVYRRLQCSGQAASKPCRCETRLRRRSSWRLTRRCCLEWPACEGARLAARVGRCGSRWWRAPAGESSESRAVKACTCSGLRGLAPGSWWGRGPGWYLGTRLLWDQLKDHCPEILWTPSEIRIENNLIDCWSEKKPNHPIVSHFIHWQFNSSKSPWRRTDSKLMQNRNTKTDTKVKYLFYILQNS